MCWRLVKRRKKEGFKFGKKREEVESLNF